MGTTLEEEEDFHKLLPANTSGTFTFRKPASGAYLIPIDVVIALAGLQISHDSLVQSAWVQPALGICRRPTKIVLGVGQAAGYCLERVVPWLGAPLDFW